MLRSVEDFLDKFVTTAGTDYGRDSYWLKFKDISAGNAVTKVVGFFQIYPLK
jgi:uncharacterized protein YheU (UPF0270 family)